MVWGVFQNPFNSKAEDIDQLLGYNVERKRETFCLLHALDIESKP